MLNEASRLANFTNEAGIDGTVRYLRNVMGLWLLQECMRDWVDDDVVGLLREAASVEGLRSVIDASDTKFLAPSLMPRRIAQACSATGQPEPATRGQITRCIINSLALAHRRAIEQAQELSGRHVDIIHMVGGAARNRLLCQLTADAPGLPVVAGPVEAAALGNVLVQARALGLVGDVPQMRQQVADSQPLHRYEPSGDRAAWDAGGSPAETGRPNPRMGAEPDTVPIRSATARTEGPRCVALFLTCVNDTLYPETGYRRQAEQLAHRVADVFADYDAVVMPPTSPPRRRGRLSTPGSSTASSSTWNGHSPFRDGPAQRGCDRGRCPPGLSPRCPAREGHHGCPAVIRPPGQPGVLPPGLEQRLPPHPQPQQRRAGFRLGAGGVHLGLRQQPAQYGQGSGPTFEGLHVDADRARPDRCGGKAVSVTEADAQPGVAGQIRAAVPVPPASGAALGRIDLPQRSADDPGGAQSQQQPGRNHVVASARHPDVREPPLLPRGEHALVQLRVRQYLGGGGDQNGGGCAPLVRRRETGLRKIRRRVAGHGPVLSRSARPRGRRSRGSAP